MTEGVKEQEAAAPEKEKAHEGLSDKEINFRKLESAREQDREARIRAEMKAEAMEQELQEIKAMLQPKEQDPLDGIEDDYIDAKVLRAKLERERAHLKKEAKEIAKQTIREERESEEKRNFLQRLKSQFSDYDQVMNESNIANLEQIDPVFLETVLEVPDDYARRLKTYKKLKSLQSAKQKQDDKVSIKEKVDENAKNPYYIPPSAATPAAVDFDIKSKNARQQAYEKLKQAQRNPIGNAPVR